MTLVELIVVIVVSGIVLSVIGLIFINGWSAQQRATERNAATAQLNAATAAITETVRDSSAIRVSAPGQRLDAKVLLADGASWQCRAWQVLGGELRYNSGPSSRPAASTSWASLASGIAGNLAAGAAFAQSGDRLSLGLRITQGEVSVGVTNGAVSQAIQEGGPACW